VTRHAGRKQPGNERQIKNIHDAIAIYIRAWIKAGLATHEGVLPADNPKFLILRETVKCVIEAGGTK
jgi:hypothetical protein